MGEKLFPDLNYTTDDLARDEAADTAHSLESIKQDRLKALAQLEGVDPNTTAWYYLVPNTRGSGENFWSKTTVQEIRRQIDIHYRDIPQNASAADKKYYADRYEDTQSYGGFGFKICEENPDKDPDEALEGVRE